MRESNPANEGGNLCLRLLSFSAPPHPAPVGHPLLQHRVLIPSLIRQMGVLTSSSLLLVSNQGGLDLLLLFPNPVAEPIASPVSIFSFPFGFYLQPLSGKHRLLNARMKYVFQGLLSRLSNNHFLVCDYTSVITNSCPFGDLII